MNEDIHQIYHIHDIISSISVSEFITPVLLLEIALSYADFRKPDITFTMGRVYDFEISSVFFHNTP